MYPNIESLMVPPNLKVAPRYLTIAKTPFCANFHLLQTKCPESKTCEGDIRKIRCIKNSSHLGLVSCNDNYLFILCFYADLYCTCILLCTGPERKLAHSSMRVCTVFSHAQNLDAVVRRVDYCFQRINSYPVNKICSSHHNYVKNAPILSVGLGFMYWIKLSTLRKTGP